MGGMPAITMENNVIHNNEGFGVILVKPGNEEHQVPADRTDGEQQLLVCLLFAEDVYDKGVCLQKTLLHTQLKTSSRRVLQIHTPRYHLPQKHLPTAARRLFRPGQQNPAAPTGTWPLSPAGSGSSAVSWAETRRHPAADPSRIWWSTRSSSLFRGTSSNGTAGGTLALFSIDGDLTLWSGAISSNFLSLWAAIIFDRLVISSVVK